MSKLNVSIDFDGVLNTYKGWKGEKVIYTPYPGVDNFLEKLSDEYNVIVSSIRRADNIAAWLHEYNLDDYIFGITDKKPNAIAYIDDRAILFDGNYNKVLKTLKNFKTHWE